MNPAQMAFVFPGQGSQSLGMLQEHLKFKVVQETIAQLNQSVGPNLWDFVQNGPENDLNKTQNTQPILLAASFALWRAWQAQGGVVPRLLAGHSLGEYTALVCAQALSFEDALKLVHLRGKLMQNAVPPDQGAMAAVLGLQDDVIRKICEEVQQDEVVAPANFNAIGQTVIAGHKTAVERFAVVAKEKGAKRVLALAVSVPSHCALMKEAAKGLEQALNQIKIVMPTIPVIHNVDMEISQHPDDIRMRLVQQLYSPVRWVESIQRLKNENIKQIIECGPGKVLTGLIKRIDDSLETFNLDTMTGFESALSQ